MVDNRKISLTLSVDVLLLGDILLFTSLLLASWKYVYGLDQLLDIGLYDESNYLSEGVRLWQKGLPSAQFAPLYAIWYWLLSIIQPDRIALYYLNYSLMVVLLPLALYVILRRYLVNPFWAVTFSFLFLVSSGNFATWPKVSHFALLIVLSTIIGATFFQRTGTRLSLFTVGALLCSYVRPEFFLTFVILLVGSIGYILFNFKKERFTGILVIFILLLVSGGFTTWWGWPIGSGNRSFIAFGQHFSLNWVDWTKSNLSPWTDWQSIISLNFNDSQNMFAAFRNNPIMFTKHIITNIRRLPMLFVNTFFLHATILFPPSLQEHEKHLLLLIFFICIIYMREKWISWFNGGYQRYKPELFIFASFIFSPLISSIVIFPRQHYVIIWGLLITLLLAIIVFDKGLIWSGFTITKFFMASLLIVAMTPPSSFLITSNSQPNKNTIRFIESLNIKHKVYLLEAEGGYSIYLGDNFSRVSEYSKNQGFDDFHKAKNINMIVLSKGLRNDSRFRSDKEWADFLDNHTERGYVLLEIPRTDRTLLVAQYLLKP